MGSHSPGSSVDHTRMPIVEGMRWYHEQGFASFATPGHRLGGGTHPEMIELLGRRAWELDIPVSGGATDVHFKRDVIDEAEQLGAHAWGSRECHYLVNGSSAGNLAFFLAHLAPGDRVIISRDIHKSLMTALIHTGVQPIYIAPQLHPELDFGLGVDAAQIERALEANPDAKLIALVSPSYSGVSSDLKGIADVAHRHGVPVYVDEAWGPHFHFHPGFPPIGDGRRNRWCSDEYPQGAGGVDPIGGAQCSGRPGELRSIGGDGRYVADDQPGGVHLRID